MNARELRHWKDRELATAESLAASLRGQGPRSIARMFPEFTLSGTHTTSLDPLVPVWALLPFFEKIVVGVMPYIKDEETFKGWYGLSVRQLLALEERGRVHIRLLFPSTRSTIPRFLSPLFSRGYPSSARDDAFNRMLLTHEGRTELELRFNRTIGKFGRSDAVDGFSNRARAFRTARTVFLQLHALGYEDQAGQFEEVWSRDQDAAIQWLNLCRLLLVGPTHYSLNGIHSVASRTHELSGVPRSFAVKFPGELGKIVVDALELARFRDPGGDFTLDDILSLYPDFEQARTTLFSLHSAIERGAESALESAEALRQMLTSARSRRQRWLRIVRLGAATGIGAATAPFNWAVGVLAGLGFEVVTDRNSQAVNRAILNAGDGLGFALPRHLTLLLDLEDSVRRHFK